MKERFKNIGRGLLFDRLKKAMPVGLAMVLSLAAFGLMHGQIIWVCYAAVVGLFLAYIYHKTGSILPTIAAHMFLNGTCIIWKYDKNSRNSSSRNTWTYWSYELCQYYDNINNCQKQRACNAGSSRNDRKTAEY